MNFALVAMVGSNDTSITELFNNNKTHDITNYTHYGGINNSHSINHDEQLPFHEQTAEVLFLFDVTRKGIHEINLN